MPSCQTFNEVSGTSFQLGHYIHDRKTAERKNEEDILNVHATQVATELSAHQSWLHCCIDGIETDKLLIRFSHVDGTNLDREFSFVLDVSEPSYNGVLLIVFLLS